MHLTTELVPLVSHLKQSITAINHLWETRRQPDAPSGAAIHSGSEEVLTPMSATLAIEVTDLVVARAQDVEHHVRPTHAFFSWLQALVQSFFAKSAEKAILNNAKYFVDQAVWFEGARAHLASRPEGAKAMAERTRHVIEALETKILTSREEGLRVLALVEKDGGRVGSARVATALRAELRARSDLYEAVVAYRWAAMELDADQEIASGQVATFEDVDALLADLYK